MWSAVLQTCFNIEERFVSSSSSNLNSWNQLALPSLGKSFDYLIMLSSIKAKKKNHIFSIQFKIWQSWHFITVEPKCSMVYRQFGCYDVSFKDVNYVILHVWMLIILISNFENNNYVTKLYGELIHLMVLLKKKTKREKEGT